MKSTLKGLALATLSASLLLTPISSMAMGLDYLKKAPNDKTGISNIEGALKHLTDQQRMENNLVTDVTSKLHITSEVNLNNEENIDIIVQFSVEPVEIQMKQGKSKSKGIGLPEAKAKVDQSHQDFKEKIGKMGKSGKAKSANENITIKDEYKHAFNGVAMTLPAKEVMELIEFSEVKGVWLNEKIQVEQPKVVQSAVEEDRSVSTMMKDSIPFLEVDTLHDEGITGKGIKVGVLDTGIDYHHPDLKAVYKGGYDFVDNDADPMETTYEDWSKLDPNDWPETWNGSSYWTSHGTHVSGIIAGQAQSDSELAITGVANGVELYGYRVLGPYGSGDTSGILSGIDRAVADGMDVINLSLGAGINDPLYPTSTALNNAMEAGTVALVAAGNTGPEPYTLGSPGASALAITVGASDVPVTIPTMSGESEGNTYNMRLLAKHFDDRLAELQNTSLSLVDAGLGHTEDFEGKDLKGKAVLIERGTIAFNEKIANAKKAGASAVIIWNDVDGVIPHYLGEGIDYIPTFTLTQEEGQRLQDGLAEGTLFNFKDIGEVKTDGDNLADFSSRGPSLKTYDIKPEITAPGVSILSTVPYYINSKEEADYNYAYERMSGTSMATPFAAGVAALILQQHPDYTPFDVKTALMNSADDLREDYSVFQVGAGRVDPYHAVHSEVKFQVMDTTPSADQNFNRTIVDDITGAISFGYHAKEKDGPTLDSRKVEIQNDSNQKKDFHVSVELLSSDISGANDADANGVTIKAEDTVSVEANSKVEFSPSIEIPSEAKSGTYEGYIHFTNKNVNDEQYQIPFSIIVAERGLDYSVDRPAFATDTSKFHPYLQVPATFIYMTLRSPMDTMDLVVKDGNTGEYIGYLGSFNPESINDLLGMELLVPFVFTSGAYYPFTGDSENPISDTPVQARDGAYELEIVATDANGDTFRPSDYVFIDNEAPEVTMEQKPGVYEIEYNQNDEQGVTWFNGKAYDSNIDLMKEKGLTKVRDNFEGILKPVDQGLNTIVGYDLTKDFGFPTHFFTPEADGSFKFGVTPEEVADGQYVEFQLYGFDQATAGDMNFGMNHYYFIGKGEQYAEHEVDKHKLYLNDEVTVTLTMNNVKDLTGGEFNLAYMKQYFEFVGAKATPQFEKFASDHHAQAKVETGEIIEDLWENTLPVSASLDGEVTNGIAGDMPIAEVTFKVINDESFGYANGIRSNGQAKYFKLGETEAVEVPDFKDSEPIEIVPRHSMIWGYIGPEAFLHEEGWVNQELDDKGIKFKAIAPDGKEYKGELDNTGGISQFVIHGIPASLEEYEVVVSIPGHFESRTKVEVGIEEGGEILGVKERVFPGLQLAGDVDGDNIIDISDAIISVFSYGKEGVGVNKGDINQDGKVDETDLRFIEKNFLEKGTGAKKNKKPKEKHGKVTLEKLFHSIGLELKQ
ncbi:S8 family serine peptidase [Rossellomorea arthrocnemi]|uniref:S8 family serine peptidase n=1 Tax=Rossellomorea arthrocnemi TaxID=2769542 RepID=UPI001918A899|nr:S8 family serine peptidase [Rossellomorea arthrocnemi]